MSVRIRVYPQTGALGGLGMNTLGGQGAVSASTYFNSRLQTQKQVSSLQLGYERALWNERLDKVRLEERLKNPYAAAQLSPYGAGGYGLPAAAGVGYGLGGLAAGIPMGGIPLGGVPLGGVPYGGVPMGGLPIGGAPIGNFSGGFPGSGQSNVTNQTSAGAASQSVTNSNVLNVSSQQQTAPPYGYGYPQTGFGGGGFLSGLLGALI
ncbi:MAG: hypothetical protein JWM98_245 [Thermoleophilia bacterium]|nr:hypothetical protein [Thermoleophilia bacterium]